MPGGAQLAPDAPTPSPTPALTAVKVTLRLLTTGAGHYSPYPDIEVILSAGQHTLKAKTNKNGFVTFNDVSCGGDIRLSAPEFQIQMRNGEFGNAKPWLLKRKLECDKPEVNLGMYSDLEGKQVPAKYSGAILKPY